MSHNSPNKFFVFKILAYKFFKTRYLRQNRAPNSHKTGVLSQNTGGEGRGVPQLSPLIGRLLEKEGVECSSQRQKYRPIFHREFHARALRSLLQCRAQHDDRIGAHIEPAH